MTTYGADKELIQSERNQKLVFKTNMNKTFYLIKNPKKRKHFFPHKYEKCFPFHKLSKDCDETFLGKK